MTDVVRRGFNPRDEYEFCNDYYPVLKKAGEEIHYLINRGYDMKSASRFIGDHYMLSERQRMALSRILSTKGQLETRKNKQLNINDISSLHIDGFNTIITLEVALSQSLILKGLDGTYRDLAGLRGNYRIVDKTILAMELLLKTISDFGIEEVFIYLDKPVSNSGRLKSLIYDLAISYPFNMNVEVINEVDSILEQKNVVVSSDGIILDRCISWCNLNSYIIENLIEKPWILELNSINHE